MRRLLSYVPGTPAWRMRIDQKLCMQTGARIQEIVDGVLPSGEATRQLERHLEACKRCGGEAEAVRRLKGAIARVGRTTDPQMLERLEGLCRELVEAGDEESE